MTALTNDGLSARAAVCGWTPFRAFAMDRDEAEALLLVPDRMTRQQRRHAERQARKRRTTA